MSRIVAMLFFGLLGLGWSGQSLAQAAVCNFVSLTPATQMDVAGGTVSFQIQAQGACPATVAISLAVDTTGDTTFGASVVPPAITTIASGTPYTVQVMLGTTSGGTGVVDATCTAGCTGAPTVQLLFATSNDIDWTPVPASLTIAASQLTSFNFGTNLVINGTPSSAITTTFTNVTTTANYGTVTPDSFGDANSGPQTIATASTYTLRATPNCPVTFVLEGCSALAPIDFTLTIEPVSVTRISAATESIVSGDSVTVTARYGSPSFPQPDGQTLLWSVAQPPGGDGSITPSAIAGGAGETQGVFTATVPGVYTVSALTTCTFCSPNSTTFSITVAAAPFNLTLVSANPATGVDGDPFNFTVALDQGGTPVIGASIEWTSVTPFSPANDTTFTDGFGQTTATFTPTGAGTFTGAVTALYDPDGIAGNGDEVTASFDADVTAIPTLVINGGDGQTTPVNTNFGSVLSVIAADSGTPVAGVGIDWVVTGGTATILDSGLTDSFGEAHLSVTPTSVGAITITATRQDDPTATVTFNLTSTAPFNISRVSANPATGTVGAPITFTVGVDQGGTPVVGGAVQWTANAPFSPATASGTTDGLGESSVTFTPSAGGTYTGVVTATYDPDGVPANGDEISTAFDANIAAVPTLVINGGDAQTTTVNTAYASDLSVIAADSGTPVAGVGIDWVVTGGTATVVDGGVTDATGEAHLSVTPTSVGTITITATRQDDATATVTFNLTSTASFSITRASANPGAGAVGAPLTFTVAVDQGGTPVVGGTVQWTANAPFAPGSAVDTTDGLGESSATFTPSAGGSFTNVVTATYDPDGVPASGDEISVAFDANINVATLAINAGDGQSGTVGIAYPLGLEVLAEDSGVPAANVTINWLVTGGTATIAPNGPTDAAGLATAIVTPTSAGTITISATRQDAPAASVSFTLTAAALVKTLTAVSPNPASGTVGMPIDFTVRLEQAGVPVNAAAISWSSTAPFAPATFAGSTDTAGDSTATFTASTPGTFIGAVTALYDGDGIPASGDELTVLFDVDVSATSTLTITGGDGQTATVGSPFALPLEVLAENGGTPVGSLPITWTLASGSALITSTGQTDGLGVSTAAITASAAGPIVITAERPDAPGVLVTFNLTAVAPTYALAAVSANPATGTVGAPVPVTVELTQGGTPVPGASIQWSAGTPFTPASSSSTTSAAGQASASFTPSAAGAFPAAITASHDPDGVPASGDEVTFSFDTTIASVATLAITGGDGQSALPNAVFALPLQVLAEDSGVAAAGVGILWSVVGDATVAPSGATDATGAASATVTAGATAGAVVVTATRQDDPTVSVSFNLTVSALGTLTIVSGDGQTLQSGVVSAPMQVELKDAGGLPLAGATIGWTTSAGNLASASSVTNAAGIASNTLTTSATGKVQVTASSPLAAASAVFSHNGGLANLTGLDPLQTEVVKAIDTLCPALAALPSLTPDQADLLARCRELTDAGGIDRDAAIEAVDELMTDVARAQGNSAMLALQAQFQNLKTRIAALRSGTQGTSFGGLAINTPTGPISLDTLSSAFSAAEEPTTEVGTDFSRWGFFASGTIGRGEADEGRIDPAYDYDIEGLTAGFDYRHGDNWIFGGAFGYTSQDTDLPNGQGSIDTSGWTLSAYSTYYTPDSWYADGVLTFGSNDYDMVRHIDYTVPVLGGGTSTIAQTARADEGGNLFESAFTIGRDFNRGALGIGPYARLLYTRVDFDAIEEETISGLPGSGLGLRVEERELTSLASVIGGKFTYTYSTDWGVLMPHAQLEWEHEFKDDPQSIEARFLNDPTGTGMLVRGDPLDTDYFRVGLGLSMVLTRGRSGFVYYEHLLGRDGMSQWNLALGLRLEF